MAYDELTQLSLPVVPFTITGETRPALLEGLKLAIERKQVMFPAVPPLLRQLRVFETRKTPHGNWRPEAPPGENDDAVFALALGLTACAAPSPIVLGGMGARTVRYLPTQEEAEEGGIQRPQSEFWRRRAEARSAERFKALVASGVELE